MKLLKPSLLLTVLLAFVTAAHAEVVGRVLMAAGDASVIRDNRVLRAAVGTPVEDKDTLQTGPASNMQVRFTDESIVSLRDQSLLKIDEYKFTGKPDGVEKAFFNLLKGGFRTVTGLIGRVNKTNYGVKTATATIGIRGTHFALLHCTAGSCGAAAKDGVYGGVSGGTIAAINNTGEYQFGSGDYFYAPSQDTPVKKLIGPPGFFADHLAGQKRGVKPSFGKGDEQTQNGGYAADGSPNFYSVLFARLVLPPPPPVYVLTQPPVYLVNENKRSDGSPCVLTISSAPCVVPGIAQPAQPAPATSTLGAGGIAFFTSATSLELFPISGSFTSTPNGLHEMASYSSSNASGSLGSASVVDSDINVSAGNLRWGRWEGTGSTASSPSGPSFFCNNCNLHYAIGDMPTMPTSGTATYLPIGGTNPTDATGVQGAFLGGLVSVNFVLQSMATNLRLSFNSAMYDMNGSTNYSSNGQFQTGLTGICSLGSCSSGTSVSGDYAGSFTGTNAAGIAMVYSVSPNPASPTSSIVGAQGFKKQ